MEKANGVKENTVTYTMKDLELQSKLDSPPCCQTRDVTIIVRGTLEQAVTVKYLYGNGRSYLKGNTKQDFSVTAPLVFQGCGCKLDLESAILRSNRRGSDQDMLSFMRCADVEATNVDISDRSGSKQGVSANRSCVLLCSTGISGCKWASWYSMAP